MSIEAFIELIKDMDIPEQRRSGEPEHLRWFLRNAPVRNHSHANLKASMDMARELLK